MPRWVEAARQWVARVTGREPVAQALLAGEATALDGLSAVLATEALLDAAAADAAPARQALALAAGRSMGGLRASAWLDGPDLLAAHDRLAWCAGRGLPLVVHATLGAADGHADAAGSGHEGWHGVAGTGCFQLLARNVQEAVDLALVARIAAEEALVPGLVGMDREQTAMAVQSVRLPPLALREELVGGPEDLVPAPTAGQRALFGAERRRVPAWFDLARPALLGGTQGPEAWGLGAAARRPWSLQPVEGILERAMRRVSDRTGRPLGALHLHRVEDATLVVVTQGSLSEPLVAVVDLLRARARLKVGVVTIRSLRPFPLQALRMALAGKARVLVVERVDAPLAADGPLAAEVRAALSPPTRMQGVACGLGGLPVRAADLALLCESPPDQDRVYLGLDFVPAASRYPKRQAGLDALRRDHPELVGLGLRAGEDAPLDARPAGSTTVELVRPAGRTAALPLVATLLQAAGMDGLRGRPAEEWLDEAVPRVDRLTFGPTPLGDPGDAVPAELTVLVPPMAEPGPAPVARLVDGGAVLILAPGDDAHVLAALPPALRAALARKGASAWAVDPGSEPDDALAGGLLRLLRERGLLETSDRALLAARKAALDSEVDPARAEARLASFQVALDGLRAVQLPPPQVVPAPPLPEPPLAVRHLADGRGALDGVPAFWSQVGVLYARGHQDELSPDPLLASGVVPPLTATFRDLTPTRDVFPAFDPQLCTGCARCWAACPDGSIAAVTIGPRALLDAGMELARAAGTSADGLKPIAGKIAARLGKDAASGSAGEALGRAVDAVVAEAGLAEDRAAAAKAGGEAVRQALAALPVSRTAPFFDQAPADQRELLAVVFDTETCKACRSCWAVCPTQAITPRGHDEPRIAAARQAWRLWERLPDTAGATIARVAERPDVDPVGALLLSRHALLAMAGADAAEPGSGDRLALRAVLGVAEARLQPQLQRLVTEAEALARQAREAVRQGIAAAVPAEDVEAMAQGLAGMGRHQVDLPTLLARVGAERGRPATLPAPQAERIATLLARARDLDGLVERLRSGAIGLGRARMGLVMGPGPAAWWGTLFPYNPFQVPVVDDGGPEAAALARGLLDAQLQAAIADLDLLRRARVAVEGRGKAQPARTWEDLSAEERAACPPIVVVGDDRLLHGGGLDALLATGLPVRVLVLSDNDLLGPASLEPGLLAMARARGVFAAQSSLGVPGHLARVLTDAFTFAGPALLRLHAPSPRRHGFDSHGALVQAALAVRSRAWPLLRLDPRGDGVFGSLVDLDGNPEPTEAQATVDGVLLGPVDWARSEGRYAQVEEGRLQAAAAARLQSWRVLQELSGVVTPFTETVRAQARAEVQAAHQAELDALRAAHSQAMAEARAGTTADLAVRLRDRLLALSGGATPGEG